MTNQESDERRDLLPISPSAMLVLSRCAKREVRLQLRTAARVAARRQLRTSHDIGASKSRSKARSRGGGADWRPGVQSAPADLTATGDRFSSPALPEIVVVDASSGDGRSAAGSRDDVITVHHDGYDIKQTSLNRSNNGQVYFEERERLKGVTDDKQQQQQQQQQQQPQRQHRSESSDALRRQAMESTRSPVYNSADWEWVRERLASRESARPESQMTFDDFLDTAFADSDQYDTDLEEDFELGVEESPDPTGMKNYERSCSMKGILPTRRVAEKLESGRPKFAFHHRCLTSNDLFTLSAGLEFNECVSDLNLSQNYIDDGGAKHVARMLKRNEAISRLDLSRNVLVRGKSFASMLRNNSTLTHVSLSNNRINDQQTLIISEALVNNHSLLSLDLSHNQLSDPAAQALSAALLDNDVLTSLNLAWNMLGRLTGSVIGKMLQENATLRSLDLSWNGLGDDGAALLGNALRANAALRHLSLAVNHIGPFGAERLAEGICAASSSCDLWYLDLDRNPLGRKALNMMIKHVSSGRNMSTLSISQVVLPPDTAKELRDIATTNSAASIFYEGQKEEAQRTCATQSVAGILRKILALNGTDMRRFYRAVDPQHSGLTADNFRRELTDLREPLSELEVEGVATHLRLRESGGGRKRAAEARLRYADVAELPQLPVMAASTGRSKARRRRSMPGTTTVGGQRRTNASRRQSRA